MRTLDQKQQRRLLDSINRDNFPKEVRKFILDRVKAHIQKEKAKVPEKA